MTRGLLLMLPSSTRVWQLCGRLTGPYNPPSRAEKVKRVLSREEKEMAARAPKAILLWVAVLQILHYPQESLQQSSPGFRK